MKTLLGLLSTVALFVLPISWAAQAQTFIDAPDGKVLGLSSKALSPDTKKLLRYNHSYHQMVLNPDFDGYEKSLVAGCGEVVRSYLGSGGTFYVDEIANATVPLSDFKRNHPEFKNRFFHWSRAEAIKTVAEKSDFSSIYEFLRSPERYSNYNFTQLGHLYVADDPKTSSQYGSFLIHANLKPEARVLAWADQTYGDLQLHTYHLNEVVAKWLSDKSPELKRCFTEKADVGDTYGHPLTYLALEASGVDISNYLHNKGRGWSWYYITNPFVIETMGSGE